MCSNESGQTDMWIMKKESWTKMHTININPPHNNYDHPKGYDFYQFSPFFCISNKGELLFEYNKVTFMIYDTKDDSMRYQKVTYYHFFMEVNIYIESLVWPLSQKERMQWCVKQLTRLKTQPRRQQLQRLKKLRRKQW